MATINSHTFVSNFNADDQPEGVELMTDERGHLYPLAHLFEGEVLGDAFKLSPTNPASMQVTITGGYAQVPFSDYAYQCWLDQNVTLSIDASNQSLSRISKIVAYVDRGKIYNASQTNNPGLLNITEVKGSNASTPTAPTNTQIRNAVGVNNPFIVLAQVYVPANATTITANNLTDLRTQITLKQGVNLPLGTYASGFNPASGSASSLPIDIAIINAGASIPSSTSGSDLLVIEIAQ